MRKITTIEELRAFILGITIDIKEAIQTIIDAFEDMQKLIDELSDVAKEKETYSFVFNLIKSKLRKSKYKRLWKRQKIP